MKTTYFKLDYDQIVKSYPLSVKHSVKWLASKEDIIQGLGAIENDGEKYKNNPNLLYELIGQIMPAIIQQDPRKLYEFFDENNIRISILDHPDSKDDNISFTYHNSVTNTSNVSPTRGEAEKCAFNDAFKLMEENLRLRELEKKDK
jgi:hypothetical protein